MKDRTLTSTFASISAPIPMPGQLAVSYYSERLKTRVDESLAKVPAFAHVIATGTLTRVRHLDPRGGRVMAVLTDPTTGDSAFVSFSANTVQRIAPLLFAGARVLLVGHATQATAKVPAGITVYNGTILGFGESGARVAAQLTGDGSEATDSEQAAA